LLEPIEIISGQNRAMSESIQAASDDLARAQAEHKPHRMQSTTQYTIPACQYDRVLARRAFKIESYGGRTNIGKSIYKGRHLHATSRPRFGGTGRFIGKNTNVDDVKATSDD
jgi:hypothetical protein